MGDNITVATLIKKFQLKYISLVQILLFWSDKIHIVAGYSEFMVEVCIFLFVLFTTSIFIFQTRYLFYPKSKSPLLNNLKILSFAIYKFLFFDHQEFSNL